MSLRFWAKSTSSSIAGVYLHPQSVMMAQHDGDKLWVQERSVAEAAEWQDMIASLLQEAPESDVKLHVVLASNFTQTVPIDKPQVSDEELVAAIPWAIKDLVADSIHDLVTDYYYCGSAPNAPERVNVVCCRRQWIEQIAAIGRQLGVEIGCISTESVVVTNLIDSEVVCQLLLWQLPGSELQLEIVHQGVVKFSRQLRGFSQLSHLADVNSNSRLLDDLSLELQRSIDYASGTLKLPDVSKMQLVIASPQVEAIGELIEDNLAISVSSSIKQVNLTAEQLRYAPAVAGLLEVAS